MRHMKSTVTGTLQEKNGRFYMVLRIPDSTGKLHQKWVSTGLPVQGNQRRARQLLDAKLVELQADYDRRSRQAGWSVVTAVLPQARPDDGRDLSHRPGKLLRIFERCRPVREHCSAPPGVNQVGVQR